MKKILLGFLVLTLVLSVTACKGKKGANTSGDMNGGGEGMGADSQNVPGLKTVYFDFDDPSIRTDQQAVLQSDADFLKANADLKPMIEGSCDERGTNEYNMALGDRRAHGVKNYLVNLGIDPARLSTVSYGEEKPVATCHDESCWWQNRRADFTK